jgi:hypothetical protein
MAGVGLIEAFWPRRLTDKVRDSDKTTPRINIFGINFLGINVLRMNMEPLSEFEKIEGTCGHTSTPARHNILDERTTTGLARKFPAAKQECYFEPSKR